MLGEFPWQVRVGESAEVTDYVSPPRVISSEQTGNEVTWSMGEYMLGQGRLEGVQASGHPPKRGRLRKPALSHERRGQEHLAARLRFLLLALVVLMIGFDRRPKTNKCSRATTSTIRTIAAKHRS